MVLIIIVVVIVVLVIKGCASLDTISYITAPRRLLLAYPAENQTSGGTLHWPHVQASDSPLLLYLLIMGFLGIRIMGFLSILIRLARACGFLNREPAHAGGSSASAEPSSTSQHPSSIIQHAGQPAASIHPYCKFDSWRQMAKLRQLQLQLQLAWPTKTVAAV